MAKTIRNVRVFHIRWQAAICTENHKYNCGEPTSNAPVRLKQKNCFFFSFFIKYNLVVREVKRLDTGRATWVEKTISVQKRINL